MVVVAAAAQGAQPTARLEYTPTVATCPPEDVLRGLVAAKLGYDPFRPEAPMRIAVSFAESSDSLSSSVRITSAEGQTAERTLKSAPGDCAELSASTALTIAIAIDPLLPTRVERRPMIGEPQPERIPEPVPGPTPETRPALNVAIDAEALLGIGQAPEVGIGGALRVWLLGQSLAGAIEVRGDAPSSIPISGGRVGSSLFAAEASGCYRWKSLAACVLLGGGAVRAFGDGFAGNNVKWVPWVAAGARVGVQVPLGKTPLYFEAHADAVFQFVRSALLVGDEEAWRMPLIGGTAGVGLGYRIE
ncbi:MAG: hypothetical protein QM817_05760 [Archangium sp.]